MIEWELALFICEDLCAVNQHSDTHQPNKRMSKPQDRGLRLKKKMLPMIASKRATPDKHARTSRGAPTILGHA
jgi:hypothetical protein